MRWLAIHCLLIFAVPAIAGVRFVDDTAYYHGVISNEQNHRLFEALGNRVIRRLVITSSGGEVRAGIELGSWVHDKQLDIEVPEYCLSSCANYVFTAGNNKIINQGAMVAWHGNYHHLKHTGLWKDDVERRIQRTGVDRETATHLVEKQVDELVSLERDFFSRIGVDQYVCWVGKMPPHNAPNYYFLSAGDMAGFGIQHVQVPEGYGQTDLSNFAEHIIYIQLGDTQ